MKTVRVPGLCLCIQLGLWGIATAHAQAQGTAAAASASSSDEDALIHHGVELRRAHDDLAARAEFQKAYDLTHSPRAAAQIGLAEYALGRFDDAEAHIREALRASNDPWIGKYRKELDQSLSQVQAHVARVEVIGDPPGAEVFVNGRSAGHLPLANPVSVNEGQVDVELRAAGYRNNTRTVTLTGRQYQRLVIRLEPQQTLAMGTSGAAAAAVPVQANLDAPEARPPSPSDPHVGWRVAKWTTLGLAGVAATTGIIAATIAAHNTSNLEGAGCQEMNGKAVDAMGKLMPVCQPYLDVYNTAHKTEIVAFVGAGALAVTWLVLMLAEPPSAPGAVAVNTGSITAWSCTPSLGSTTIATCAFHF